MDPKLRAILRRERRLKIATVALLLVGGGVILFSVDNLMNPDAAGHSTLSDALHYRKVQVIILLHTLASRLVPTALLHLLWLELSAL